MSWRSHGWLCGLVGFAGYLVFIFGGYLTLLVAQELGEFPGVVEPFAQFVRRDPVGSILGALDAFALGWMFYAARVRMQKKAPRQRAFNDQRVRRIAEDQQSFAATN